jgi:hypothetical protein
VLDQRRPGVRRLVVAVALVGGQRLPELETLHEYADHLHPACAGVFLVFLHDRQDRCVELAIACARLLRLPAQAILAGVGVRSLRFDLEAHH